MDKSIKMEGMSNMSKYSKYIQIPANILLLLAIAFFCVALFGERISGEAYIGKFDTMTFNDSWQIQGENGNQDITLPTVLPNCKGTTVTLENVLPSYVKDGMRLCMKTTLQDISIYIDGELRGSYTGENLEFIEEYLPSSYVMIDLEEEDAEKQIQIQITIWAQGRINEVTIGYGNNAWFAVLYKCFPVTIAALVLTIVGCMSILSYFLVRKLISSSKAILFLGQAMIVIGCWIISESEIRQLLFHSPSFSAFFSYMFIELIGGFVIMYFNEVQKYKYNKLYTIFETLIFGQAAINTVLALSGLVEFYDTLIFSHIWIVIGIIAFLITLVIDAKTKQMKKYSIMAWGMLIFILFCIFEIVEFYYKDFYIFGMYLCVGLIILLVATIIQIIVDEVEKVRQTVELERAKEEAESANRLKSQFLARMSHEMRTPVNAILGMNEMILRESKEENVRGYAKDVKNSSVTLLNIINEILDSSKIESGMMEIVAGNYELGSFLNDLYNMVNVKAKEQNLDLIFDIDPAIPCEYYGDDKRIRQVLVNLLTNGIKYTHQGSVILKLTCSQKEDTAFLHYSVKDTGIGIREEDIGKIYDVFSRFDVSRNRNVEGTGLGMNIVQQLLKLMGSELKIQSEYEKGSEFSFDIEQRIVNREPLGDFRHRILEAGTAGEYQTTYVAPKARVLVVDDNKMNLKVFRNLLKQTQMQIFEAESGKECLDMLSRQSFDLIFLDHMMPEMDGMETLCIIREKKLCGETPIIMLTANAIIGDKEKYLKAGFDDFLSKPIIPDQLDKIILRHLPEKLIEAKEPNELKQQVLTERENCEPESVLDRLQRKLPELDCKMGMATSSDDVDFYLELLQDFVNMPIKEELTKYLKEMDNQNYCIRIHGFKSSAYSVGAKAMGDLAFEMEKLSQKELPEEIQILQKQLFEQYDRICLQYNEVVKQ